MQVQGCRANADMIASCSLLGIGGVQEYPSHLKIHSIGHRVMICEVNATWRHFPGTTCDDTY